MRIRWIFLVFCLGFSPTAQAHDRFLKLDDWNPPAGASTVVRLFNGTFDRSEKAVPRETMSEVGILTPSGKLLHPAAADWEDAGPVAKLTLRTGEPGAYILGLYTKPKDFVLPADKFNDYLEHDGIPDILAARRQNGELNKPARERYSHHTKAIFQVADAAGGAFRTPLGHPVEIIPQQNPAALRQGQALEVLCLGAGKPLVGQYVTAGVARDGMSRSIPGMRTDEHGRVTIRLDSTGTWYVKFIQMTKADDPSLDYESKWATLTFEVKDR